MSTISLSEFLSMRGADEAIQVVDVRSPSEFAAGHIPRALNVPLETLGARRGDFDPRCPLVLVCQSGRRAGMAANALRADFPSVRVLEGSTAAWIAAGHEVIRSKASSWSLERQVRLGAGLFILATLSLAHFLSPYWLFATAFIGAGLAFAGATDICGMGLLLAAMPWNRNPAPPCRPAALDPSQTKQL